MLPRSRKDKNSFSFFGVFFSYRNHTFSFSLSVSLFLHLLLRCRRNKENFFFSFLSLSFVCKVVDSDPLFRSHPAPFSLKDRIRFEPDHLSPDPIPYQIYFSIIMIFQQFYRQNWKISIRKHFLKTKILWKNMFYFY